MSEHSPCPSHHQYSDQELVKKSIENIEFFAHLFERYEHKLLMYILRISSFSREEAEEVLQESFVKAWKNLNDFDGDVKFSSWMYRIVHNTTISEWRKTQSKGKENMHKVDEEVFQKIPSSMDIAEEFSQRCDSTLIKSVLSEMPEKYREVLVLRFFEEFSYLEISDILKKTIGTVSTLVNRAKKSFEKIAQKKNIDFSFTD